MASFPVTVSTKMLLRYPLVRATRLNTGMVQFANDSEQRWRRQPNLASFALNMKGITLAQKNTVLAFFVARRGRFDWFDLTLQIGTVTAASQTAPITITSDDHGLRTGDSADISDVRGNTAANGTFTVTRLTNTTFSLNGTTGNAAYVSGGICSKKYQYMGFDTDTLSWTETGDLPERFSMTIPLRQFRFNDP